MKNDKRFYLMEHLFKPRPLAGLVLSSGLLLLLATWLTGGPEVTAPTTAASSRIEAAIMPQSEVFIVVNWPEWSSENQVELYNSSNTLLATVCDPSNCFNSAANSAYSASISAGCQDDGGGYYLILRDAFSDGWNGGGTVQVEDASGNILLGSTGLAGGVFTTPTFTVSGGGASCAPPVGPDDICVSVFNDYNSNGVKDGSGESGLEGITVTAYDASNNPSPFTYTSDGNYEFTPGNADTYRVEVTGIPADLEPTVAGATTVFFIDRGNKVEVGLQRPEEYFDNEVFIAVPCYVDGPSSAGAANANEDVLVVSPVSDMTPGDGNVSPTEYFIADHDQIGATFGVAYSRASNSIFASAFAKRHTAFGPSGTGAIYKVDLNGDAITAPVSSTGISTIVDLNALFGANTAGADPHPSVGGTDFDQDPATYDQVGKIGLGGLAMSETENVLWTINLADRRLYEIPLGGTRENPSPPASAAAISRWPATGDLTDLAGLPGSAADKDINIRPFAVKCYRGEIYIGLVSTGESTVVVNAGQVTNTGDRSQMQGFIYKFDPATDVFTQVVSFPFDYTRGQAADFCGNNGQAEFNPWTPIYDKETFETAVMGTSRTTPSFPAERVYPQPWITDIEFDEEGKMIIGVRDRFADQHGFNKLPPVLPATTQPDTFRFTADGAGDVLVASRSTVNADEFVLESNAENGANSEPFGPTTGAGFMEGPGGGEFFFDDRYRPSNAGPDGDPNAPCGEDPLTDEDPLLDPGRQQGHDEITLGGLFAYLGQELLVAAAYDPINNFNNFNNAGAIGLSTVDGSRQSASQIYATTVAGGVTFAKGNGLGDLEGLTPPAPLQIGNRLWVDGNNNGRQDADEAGLNGVLVELFKETAPGTFTKVAETTTAADAVQGNGFFIFSNNTVGSQTWVNGFTEVEEEMDYEIRVSLANVQAVDNTVMAFTTSNANGDSTNDSKTDLNDSDASPTGVIAVTSGRAGENNHTLDIGVTQSAVCSITIDLVEPSVCVPGTNEYTLSVTVTYADAPAGEMLNITTDNGGSQSFSLAGTAGTETFILTGLTSDGVADIDVTATFATTTTCTDTQVDAYTAPADCTILPCSITVNSATESVCDPGTNTYSLTVNVTYANAPAGEMIVVTTDNGASQSFTPAGTAGTEDLVLTGLTSDGVANIDVTANYSTTTGCTDTATDAYTAPANCTPTPCSITVNSATESVCDPGTNTYSLTVNVTYANAPAGEMIVVTTDNGASQSFTPAGTAGTEDLVLTGLTSDGVANIDVTANYSTTTGCTDTATDAYTAPANCTPTPCSITVNSATESVCDPGTNTYSLTVNVTYANAPAGEMIVVTTDNGASQSFTPAGTAGTEDLVLTGLTSDGVANIDVTANYSTTTGCTNTATDAYTAPANCTPCSITVNSATPGACIPATNTYDLTVSVTYANAPTEDIVITTDNGGSQTFTPTVAGAGTESFVLTGLTSDGVADIDVTANFATTTGCADTATDEYTAPDDCTPVCSIAIGNVTPSTCDPATNTYSLSVEVTYANAPAGEDIRIVTDNGVDETFTPAGTAGTETFVINNLTSDGVADIDVMVEYVTSTTCTDDIMDAYTAPMDCTPCSITVNSSTPSACDPSTNTYSLTVNVTYANAPTGETIVVTTDNGASMSFTPMGTDGSENFILTGLTSDGVADINVTATYATTMTCTNTQANAYTAPADCSCVTPGASFVPVPSDCNGITVNDNGRIVLTEVTGGDKYGVSTVGALTYDGPDYSIAPDLEATPFDIVDNIPNSGGVYYVRIYNGNNSCFLERRIEVPPNNCPTDPQGFIYCEETGEIITGGTISVTGPGTTVITLDGSSGEYQFYTDGTEGVYNITYTPPVGYSLSAARTASVGSGPGGSLDPTLGVGENVAGDAPFIIGSATSDGLVLDDFSAAANAFYLDIDFMTGDPEIFLNNIPLSGCGLTLGSTVFEDLDNNGLQEGTEAGIANVQVQLFSPGPNGMVGDGDDVEVNVGLDGILGTGDDGPGGMPTNGMGNYFFRGLPTGDYYVQIAGAEFGTGEPLAQIQISSNTSSGTFAGETGPNDNFDNDDEGVQSGGSGTVTTSGVVSLAANNEPTDADTETAQGNTQDNTTGNTDDDNGNMTIDFGFFAPVAVGDTAFVDLDGDGLQSAGDPGIGGVTVTLLDENGDQVTEDAEGNPITGTTTTAADGSYRFSNLPPGIYSVTFDVSTADNAEFYDFTTANAGNDADDSDNSIPVNATTAQSDPTPFLNSGEEDLTLDVGVICAIEVAVADPFAVCSTQPVDLTAGASISPASLGGNWMSSGDGAFYDAAGDLIAGAAVFGTAVEYRPGAQDIANGAVTLTLTTNEPDGPCEAVSASVTVQVLKVDCGQFMWDGN